MAQTSQPITADRIALTNMFKAIAEYGRKVRQRRQAQATSEEQPNQAESNPSAESVEQAQPATVL